MPFLEKKLDRLRWIQKQEAELNLGKTVDDAKIKACEEELQRMRLLAPDLEKKNYKRKIHPYTLEKFDPEAFAKRE